MPREPRITGIPVRSKPRSGERTRVHVNGVEIGARPLHRDGRALRGVESSARSCHGRSRRPGRCTRPARRRVQTAHLAYVFQGLGLEGLKLLRKAGDAFGLPVVSEAMTDSQVEMVAEYADIVQVGTRSMQNAALLAALGRCRRPVLLKRGMVASVEELLQAAEALLANGNPNVFSVSEDPDVRQADRNTCDIVAVPSCIS